MSISQKTQERIHTLYETDPEMIEKLNKFDGEAIRKVGSDSQKGLNPETFVVAYESGEESAINEIYQQAKKLVEQRELYKELCFEYYIHHQEDSENAERSSNQKRSI